MAQDERADAESSAGKKPTAPPEIARHLLPTSATMIGVCMTVVGLVKLLEVQRGPSGVDEVFGVDALGFLLSAACSYIALRYASSRWERFADAVFMIALAGMTLGGVLFAFELIH